MIVLVKYLWNLKICVLKNKIKALHIECLESLHGDNETIDLKCLLLF